LPSSRVVIPGPEVVEAGLGVEVLAGVLKGVGEAARRGGEIAIGVVGVGVVSWVRLSWTVVTVMPDPLLGM
jgi:hypothetical protein